MQPEHLQTKNIRISYSHQAVNYHFILFQQHHGPTNIYRNRSSLHVLTQRRAITGLLLLLLLQHRRGHCFDLVFLCSCREVGFEMLYARQALLHIFVRTVLLRPATQSREVVVCQQAHAGHLLERSHPMRHSTERYVQVANRVASKEPLAVKLRLQEGQVLLRLLQEPLLLLALRQERQNQRRPALLKFSKKKLFYCQIRKCTQLQEDDEATSIPWYP